MVGLAPCSAGGRRSPASAPVTLGVDPAWQRRGIGTRLLVDAARLALARGADEIVLTTRSDNQAVLPMVLAAGLRGRIRMAGDQAHRAGRRSATSSRCVPELDRGRGLGRR